MLDELRGARALVVDDNANARAILTEMLRHMGLRADAVDSGTAALARLKQEAAAGVDPYRLVLLDWNMPELDGIATAQGIQREAALKSPLSVLMVTAYDYGDLLEPAEQAGIHRVLTKPVTESSLFDAITDALLGGGALATHHRRRGQDGEADTEIARLRGARILLVEDNALNRQVACELLAAVDIEADTAVNGRDALEKLAQTHYDLVLMDIQMPEMDGLSATRKLRGDPRHAALPIVAMTAHAMAGDRELSLQAGMNDHVTKPIDPKQLYAVLSRWLRRRRGQDAATATATAARTTHAPTVLPPAMAALSEAGIDVNKGMLHHLDRIDFYLRVLRGFAAEYARAHDELGRRVVLQQWPQAVRLCHTLKSAAAGIGATGLAQQAHEMEALCREQRHDEHVSAAFAAELERVVGLLRALGSPSPPVSVAPAMLIKNAAALRPLLEMMEQRLREDDATAVDCVPVLAALVGADGAKTIKAISNAVEDLEYDVALAQLARMRESLGDA